MIKSFAAVMVCSAFGLLAWSGSPANAEFAVTIEQVGSDVVATGSGSFDLADLTFVQTSTAPAQAGILPSQPLFSLGPGTGTLFDSYIGTFSGPANFGPGGQTSTLIGSGDSVGFANVGNTTGIIVPAGYVSGSSLSDSSDFSNSTLSSLGITPGMYTYSFGTGDHQDSIVIDVVGETTAVPELSTWAMMIVGFAGVGVIGYRRKSKMALNAA